MKTRPRSHPARRSRKGHPASQGRPSERREGRQGSRQRAALWRRSSRRPRLHPHLHHPRLRTRQAQAAQARREGLQRAQKPLPHWQRREANRQSQPSLVRPQCPPSGRRQRGTHPLPMRSERMRPLPPKHRPAEGQKKKRKRSPRASRRRSQQGRGRLQATEGHRAEPRQHEEPEKARTKQQAARCRRWQMKQTLRRMQQ